MGREYDFSAHVSSLSTGPIFYVLRWRMSVIPSGIRYITRCSANPPFAHMTVNFSLSAAPSFPAMDIASTQPTKKIEQTFSKLVRTWNVRHPFYEEKCINLLYQLIYQFQCEIHTAPRRHLQKLASARVCLDEHFCEDFPLDMLPRMCELSPTYFRRLFHSVFYETTGEYRRRLRIAKARDLLLTGHYKVGCCLDVRLC